MATETVSWPRDNKMYYLRIAYRTWWIEAETINDLFDWIINKYKTEKWWDYDPFMVYTGVDETLKGCFDSPAIEWKYFLTDEQRIELKKWSDINLNMD